MKKMKLRQIDLNLLVVFEAVARLGSVQAAAEHLAMSQPAVSHALNRLRKTMDDALFLRGKNTLTMTPRASEIIEAVREILVSIEEVFDRGGFDPATSARVFRIAAADFSMLTIIPSLMQALRTEAPGARLDVTPINMKTPDHLESGWLDFAFGAVFPKDASFVIKELCPVHFGGLVSARHPLAIVGRNPTLEEYLSYPHIVTTFDHPHVNPVDVALKELGHRRHIAMASTNFISNVKALNNSDLILTTPTRLAARASLIYQGIPDEALVEFELPFTVPVFFCAAAWHRRTKKDPGNQWLREMIFRLAKTFNSTGGQ